MQLGEWVFVWGLPGLVYVPLSLSLSLWEYSVGASLYILALDYIIICVSLRTVVLSMGMVYTYIAL